MPQTELSDQDVVNLMRKDFDRRLADMCAQYGLEMPMKDEAGLEDDEPKAEKPSELDAESLSSGIRVRHKDSKLEYTVNVVNLITGHISLETPEKKVFPLEFEIFEKEYELA